jgi:hypothetical protein
MSRAGRRTVRATRAADIDDDDEGAPPDAGRPPCLLDVNVLVALAWPNHVHHAAAHAWLRASAGAALVLCPLTQAGFVRVSSNRKVTPDARPPGDIVVLLRRIARLKRYVFWPADVDLADESLFAWERIRTPQQVTDALLLALAISRGGTLVTFDGGIANLLPARGSDASITILR